MIWLIPLLLLSLFFMFRFISPYEDQSMRETGPRQNDSDRRNTTETFVAPLLVSSEVKKEYQAFRTFYESFLASWKEALTTAYSLQQSSPTEAGKAVAVSDTELNRLVSTLSTKLGKPLPSLPVTPLPAVVETLEDIERSQLLEHIPVSSQPYMDALEWMNQQFIQAQQELNKALQGGAIPSMEGFAGKESCAEISTCFKENPDLIRQLAAAQQEEAGQRLERIQRELLGRFQQFQQPRLRSAFELNGRLRQQAKETQRKAQSGEWIKDIRIPGSAGDTAPKPVAPPGTTLEELRQSNPERYAEYERSRSSLFSIKQLMEQINRNLR